jgi:hypothetical protein
MTKDGSAATAVYVSTTACLKAQNASIKGTISFLQRSEERKEDQVQPPPLNRACAYYITQIPKFQQLFSKMHVKMICIFSAPVL